MADRAVLTSDDCKRLGLEPTGRVKEFVYADGRQFSEPAPTYYSPELDCEIYLGNHETTWINVTKTASLEDTLLVYTRIRDFIASGGEFIADDDETPGNKSMQCTFGRCTENRDVWLEPRLNTFPKSRLAYNRVTQIELSSRCPFDRRDEKEWNGCFWKCEIFKGRSGHYSKQMPMSREAFVAKWDAKIAEVKSMLAATKEGE